MTNSEIIEALRSFDISASCMEDCNDCEKFCVNNDCFLVQAADALEAAEKRIAELESQLPKDGEWEERYVPDAPLFLGRRFYCSVCGDWQTSGKTKFCQNCGAKMKEVEIERL